MDKFEANMALLWRDEKSEERSHVSFLSFDGLSKFERESFLVYFEYSMIKNAASEKKTALKLLASLAMDAFEFFDDCFQEIGDGMDARRNYEVLKGQLF